MKLTWRDTDELAAKLVENHPTVDPLSLTLHDLRRLVIALPAFGDDPAAVDDRGLEAIQKAWYEAYEE